MASIASPSIVYRLGRNRDWRSGPRSGSPSRSTCSEIHEHVLGREVLPAMRACHLREQLRRGRRARGELVVIRECHRHRQFRKSGVRDEHHGDWTDQPVPSLSITRLACEFPVAESRLASRSEHSRDHGEFTRFCPAAIASPPQCHGSYPVGMLAGYIQAPVVIDGRASGQIAVDDILP